MTFLRAKQDFFLSLIQGEWRVKFFNAFPCISTLRDFTQAEKDDPRNKDLHGVRTYYFQAHHLRGFPEIRKESGYEEAVWVPKRLMNEYFDREYYDIFIPACSTR
mmetsp:Transcript_25341/g.19086  ORF Transcript_25341/g.19086 Transcript_25341/m.19086 type:complete len:105 (+) Transcript_25341:833-1147(+)